MTGAACSALEPTSAASWRPKPSGRRSAIAVDLRGARGEVPKAFHPGQDAPLSIVQALLDVRREEEPAPGRPDSERDGDRVFRLMADRDRDPVHAQLLGASRRPAVQPDGGLARGQALDLDLRPADAPDAQPEHLADRLLGGPAAGEVLRPIAHVAVLGLGQDAPREPPPEPGERRPD